MTHENFFVVNGMTFREKPKDLVIEEVYAATKLVPAISSSKLQSFFRKKAEELPLHEALKAEMQKINGYAMLYEQILGHNHEFYLCYNGAFYSVSAIDARMMALKNQETVDIADTYQLYFVKEALLQAIQKDVN